MQTVHEQATEPIACNVAGYGTDRLQRACVSLEKVCAESEMHLTLEANEFMGGDESV